MAKFRFEWAPPREDVMQCPHCDKPVPDADQEARGCYDCQVLQRGFDVEA